MKTVVLSAHTCKGTYQGKPYTNGRLVIAHFDLGEQSCPAYITVQKTTVEIAEQMKKNPLPAEMVLTYDAFKHVNGFVARGGD